MKLLRLKITDPDGFRSLPCGFEHHFRTEWSLQEELAQPEGFVRWSDTLLDADGNIGAASHDFLTKYMSKFLDWVQLQQKK